MPPANPKASKRAPSPGKKSASASSSKSPSFATAGGNTAAGEYLLERLRILLSRLQSATETLQNWPEAKGDSAKVHADTATDLIASIRKIVLGLRSVERHVNGAAGGAGGEGGNAGMSKEALEAFRTSLEEKCPIPLDLLDLLDVGQPFGMNPHCYARGLMKESLRQLAGLERRKRALDMLAEAIESGMADRARKQGRGNLCGTDASDGPQGEVEGSNENSGKRKHDEDDVKGVKRIRAS